jgi:hypothetical protein
MYLSLVSYSLEPLEIQLVYLGLIVYIDLENRARDVSSLRYIYCVFYTYLIRYPLTYGSFMLMYIPLVG